MKKNKLRKRRRADLWADARDGFVKGFVSSGLLAVLRDGNDSRRVLVTALQGGTALAAASVAAGTIGRGETLNTLAAVAAGSAGLVMIGRMAEDADTAPDTAPFFEHLSEHLSEHDTTGDRHG